MKKSNIGRIGAIVAVTLGLCGVALPAQATDTVEQVPATAITTVDVLTPGESSVVRLSDGSELTTVLGEPQEVTAQEIAQDTSLSATQKAELTALRATIKSNHYSQFTTGAAYTVTQNGTFYYNGTKVWVGTTTSGYTGSHECFLNYAVGVSITNIGCSESGSSSQRNMYMEWNVTVGPLTYALSMTANLKANGTISGAGATVG